MSWMEIWAFIILPIQALPPQTPLTLKSSLVIMIMIIGLSWFWAEIRIEFESQKWKSEFESAFWEYLELEPESEIFGIEHQ